MGAAVRYAYDTRGGLSGVVDATGAVTSIECDAVGLPVSVTDPRGAVTAYPRDAFGRVSAVTGAFGGTSRTGWSADGLMLWQQETDGVRREWSYDAAGNPVEERDGVGGVARVEYGPFGTVTARVDHSGLRHEFAYDTELRLRSITGPDGRVWTYRYDEAGRLVGETDFDGHSTQFELDAAGRTVRRTDEAGEVEFGYDDAGRLARLDADGQRSTLAYDLLGRMIRAENGAGVLEIARDALGRITAETWNGRTLAVERDVAGRVVRRTTPSGAVSEWAFDAAGLPAALRTAAGDLVFERDAAGRETSRVVGRRAAISRSYDAAGRPAGQAVWALDGDPAGNIAAAAQGANPYRLVQQRVVDYRADDIPVGIGDLIRGRSDFELDPAGRITRITRGEHSETYAYNLLGAVSEASGHERQQAAAPEGAQDRDRSATAGARQYEGYLLRRAGRTSYEYDGKGRLVHTCRRTLSGGELHWRYTWNSLGQLTGATTPDGDTWRYLYDPVGRRRAKQRLDEGGEVRDEIRFSWDDGRLAEQTGVGPDGTVRTLTWDHEPGSYLPAVQREQLGGADQEYYDTRFYAIVADLTGAPAELVAGDGSIAWYQTTDLWGAPVDAPESATGCPLRMPGQYHDPETGLDYNHHRYYDPETGTYISGDPLGLGPQPNPRTYVSNPTTGADPTGLAAGHNLGQVRAENIGVHDQAAASWLHSQLDPRAQGYRTTAVVSAVDGQGNLFHYVSTNGDRGVAGVIRNQYGPLEDWYRNQGIGGIVWEADSHANPNGGSPHAETNALQDINAHGMAPVAGGASRNVCNGCAGYLQGAGATLIGPDFRGGANTSPKRIFSW
jgi:RHS repeat-associated protein